MINVFLCDDNAVLLERYSSLITKLAKKHQVVISIHTFANAEKLLFFLEERPDSVDILYLDILMDGMNGVQAAEILRSKGCFCEIIFLTSSEEYVFDSFAAEPLQYLLKDSVSVKKFEEVFLRAIDLTTKKNKDFIVCKGGSVTKQIPLKSIYYFNAARRMVIVYFDKEEFSFYYKFEELEKELADKNFIRTHRSYLVNIRQVANLERSSLFLTDGKKIPIGKKYLKAVKEAFTDNLINSFS